MELKRRATKAELFEADEYAPSWKDHQKWRLDRIANLRAQQSNIPVGSIRFCYEDKITLDLYDRAGRHRRYRPKGVILSHAAEPDGLGMYEFNVAWVDPWGYAHTAVRSFLDLRVLPESELEYMRQLREYRQAVTKHWIQDIPKGQD